MSIRAVTLARVGLHVTEAGHNREALSLGGRGVGGRGGNDGRGSGDGSGGGDSGEDATKVRGGGVPGR